MSNQKYAVALIRAVQPSKEGQNESLAEQHQEIADYANVDNIEIRKTFTSYSRSDQVLKEILEYCEANPEVEYLFVERPSRLSRNIIEYSRYLGAFYALGVEVRTTLEYAYGIDSISDTFEDYLSMSLASIDSHARANLVKQSMLEKAKQGYSVNRPPLGYTPSLNQGIYEQTITAYALSHYFKRTLSGAMTLHDLRQKISHIYHLNDRLISRRKLRKIASNPYYAGFVSHHGKLYKGKHQPILTPEEQQQLVEMFDK